MQTSHVKFSGRLLMVGFGCIGRGVLPLLLRHIDMRPEQMRIVTDRDVQRAIANEYGVAIRVQPVTRDNYRDILAEELGPGDFLLNLSINVASVDLVAWCQEHGVLYLDACIEPWAGGYYDTSLTPSQRSNYGLRESALALRKPGRPDGRAHPRRESRPGVALRQTGLARHRRRDRRQLRPNRGTAPAGPGWRIGSASR